MCTSLPRRWHLMNMYFSIRVRHSQYRRWVPIQLCMKESGLHAASFLTDWGLLDECLHVPDFLLAILTYSEQARRGSSNAWASRSISQCCSTLNSWASYSIYNWVVCHRLADLSLVAVVRLAPYMYHVLQASCSTKIRIGRLAWSLLRAEQLTYIGSLT